MITAIIVMFTPAAVQNAPLQRIDSIFQLVGWTDFRLHLANEQMKRFPIQLEMYTFLRILAKCIYAREHINIILNLLHHPAMLGEGNHPWLCVCVCMCARSRACVRACVGVSLSDIVNSHPSLWWIGIKSRIKKSQSGVFVCICMCMCTCMCTCIYVCIYACMHVCL